MKYKICPKCKKSKGESSFHRNKNRKDGLDCWCKGCKSKHQKKWRAKHKGLEKQRHARYYKEKGYQTSVSRLYGADFDKMYTQQGGYCAICGIHQSELTKRLNVDHDHTTGEVRALLCHSCNVGLGHFSHSIDKLNLAIAYLHRYET